MFSETTLAVTYIVGPLYTNLPRRRVDDFALELDKLLKVKIAPFWCPNEPFNGIHQRCLRVNGPYADPIIGLAASKAGINPDEIFSLFPKEELKMWIDPSEVSYQLGDHNSDIQYLLRRTPPIPSPNFYLDSPCINPAYISKPCAPFFTVSSFAKTKFGSTKLKSNSIFGVESPRPDSLKLAEPSNGGCIYSPVTCPSGVTSPAFSNPPESNSINISCCLPWTIDMNNNTLSNMLTINIPQYNQNNGRESSASGSLNSQLNSPVQGY